MELDFRQVIEKFRDYLWTMNGKAVISFAEISKGTGIPSETLMRFVSCEEELVEKALAFERERFEEIFRMHDFEGVNAIDALLTVSNEIARKFKDVSPSVTFALRKHFPDLYLSHFALRRDFIFGKIQRNIATGISQGMYRADLSAELVARIYLGRLIDLHNLDFFPPEQFSFETIFDAMFDHFIRGIATPEGLAHYEHQKKEIIQPYIA